MPNLATVIPAMDLINNVLSLSSDSPYRFCLEIRATLAIGKKTLDKYYNKTDESEVYRIAMGMYLLVTVHMLHISDYDKSFTLATSWSTSSKTPGTTHRSRRLMRLFETYLTGHMHQWKLRWMIMQPG